MATTRLRVARAARRNEAPRILCLSGPNLQRLGTREPDVYGKETLTHLHDRLTARAREIGVTIDCRQTNHEGTLCDWIAETREGFDAILLNAGAYSHTSIALHDAIKAVGLPCVEVHVSNPDARESFRHESRIAAACVARVAGFGGDSYVLALEGIVARLARG